MDIHHFVEFFEKHEHFFLSLGTLGLFAFTALLFGATFLLWWATHNLVKDARENAQQQLRAYVTTEIMGWRGGILLNGAQLVPAPQPIAVELMLRNRGQTPARAAVMQGAIALLPHPLPSQQCLPALPVLARQAPVAVWPGESGPHGWVQAAAVFSEQDVNNILTAAKRLYFYGRIEYRDAFGHSRETNFTYFLDPASVRPHAGNVTFIWANAEEGNDWT